MISLRRNVAHTGYLLNPSHKIFRTISLLPAIYLLFLRNICWELSWKIALHLYFLSCKWHSSHTTFTTKLCLWNRILCSTFMAKVRHFLSPSSTYIPGTFVIFFGPGWRSYDTYWIFLSISIASVTPGPSW